MFEKPEEPGYEIETIAVLGQCRLRFGNHVTNVNGSCSAYEPFMDGKGAISASK